MWRAGRAVGDPSRCIVLQPGFSIIPQALHPGCRIGVAFLLCSNLKSISAPGVELWERTSEQFTAYCCHFLVDGVDATEVCEQGSRVARGQAGHGCMAEGFGVRLDVESGCRLPINLSCGTAGVCFEFISRHELYCLT